MEPLLLEAAERRQLAPRALHLGGEPLGPLDLGREAGDGGVERREGAPLLHERDGRDRDADPDGEERQRGRGGERPGERARAKLVGQEVRHRGLPARALERDGQGGQACVLVAARSGGASMPTRIGSLSTSNAGGGSPPTTTSATSLPVTLRQRRQRPAELGLQRAPARLGVGRHRERAAPHDPPVDDDGQLGVGRFQPEHDPAARGIARHQAGEAVDGDAHQPRREAGVPEEPADPLLAPPLDGHEQHAERPARLAGQGLEIEERLGRREGEMALELEPHHPPEVRAGDGRQLHRLGDHRAARETHLRAPGPDAGLEELAPDRARGVVVGRDAEGRDEPLRAQSLPEGDHVDLSVPEREPDDVAHRATLAALAVGRCGRLERACAGHRPALPDGFGP